MSVIVNKMGTQAWMVWLAIPFLLYPASGQSQDLVAPMADVHPTSLEEHGNVRVDEYYWLKERDNPATIKYLEAENAYLDQVMSHTKDLQQTIFDEIKGRIKQDDSTVPYRNGEYYYYVRYEDGKEYPIYCRKPGSLDAAEQVILDVNILAEGKGYLQVGQTAATEDQKHSCFRCGHRRSTLLHAPFQRPDDRRLS